MDQRNRRWLWVPTLVLVFSGSFVAVAANETNENRAKRWEAAIAKFEQQDENQPPEPGGIVFVGSSSIRLWDLDKSFPELRPLNRGFGGSEAEDALRYVERIVVKYRPRLVVYYEGDNDLAHGKSPEQVEQDTKAFLEKLHQALPETTVILLSVKPSPSRWHLFDAQVDTNRRFQDLAAANPKVKYADVASVLLDADGKPCPELYLPDKLHLNPDGYKVWTEVVTPMLQ
jgi:lysophospholipase L1-like esterase